MAQTVTTAPRTTRWLAALTVDQWRCIDAEHIRERERAGLLDARVATVLVAMTLLLIVLQYVGKSDWITGFAAVRDYFATLPHPKLMPKLYWAGWRVLGYVVLPALLIRTVLGGQLRDYGLRIDRNPRVLALYAGMLAVVLPCVWLASHMPAFIHKYPFYRQAADSWTELLAWELAYGLQFFGVEFFFRGFALFALARRFGASAIFIVMVPYTMIHFTKPVMETLGAIVAGIALGTLALRTRSIYGGVLVHTAVAWSMDLLALWHRGALARLLAG